MQCRLGGREGGVHVTEEGGWRGGGWRRRSRIAACSRLSSIPRFSSEMATCSRGRRDQMAGPDNDLKSSSYPRHVKLQD